MILSLDHAVIPMVDRMQSTGLLISPVNLSLDEANLVQSALLDRLLHIEARQRQ